MSVIFPHITCSLHLQICMHEEQTQPVPLNICTSCIQAGAGVECITDVVQDLLNLIKFAYITILRVCIIMLTNLMSLSKKGIIFSYF